MAFYFRSIPDFEYIDPSPDASISDYLKVKNLFKKSKIREDIFGNLTYFTKYNVVGNERPDQIAEKFYEDASLDWVILLSNNIIDLRNEWPLDNFSFNEVMLDKYGNYETLYSAHHYETVEVKDSSGVTVLPAGITIQNQWKTNGNFVQANSKQITQIAAIGGTTVSVTMGFGGLKNLKVGNQVTISGVSNEYDGTFKVVSTSIIVSPPPLAEEITVAFTYQLSTVPETSQPTLNGTERVTTIVYDGSILGNTYYFEYHDQGMMKRLSSTSVLKEITNYDYEINLNNKKREIFILKPNYLGIILNDVEEASSYKVGGVQFVDDKLKRGDNIRIYS